MNTTKSAFVRTFVHTPITYERAVDLQERSETISRVDLGYAFCLVARHPELGLISVVVSSSGKSLLIEQR